MKLLVITQAVDTEDPVLGFFTRWIDELAKRVERVEVVCLREGSHTLPANVRVHSLGKESGMPPAARNRFTYTIRFVRLVWRLRHEYDAVFVHMNPEYVLLGGVFWQLRGTRVAFWYNHPSDNLRLRLALLLTDRVFYTSPYAATAHSPKALRMPVGIDTELFSPRYAPRNRHALYMQGRIMPSKRVERALAALRLLRDRVPATLTLVGPEDVRYGKELRKRFKDLVDAGAVTFAGPRKNAETPALFSAHGAVVNLAAAGHFDKAVFEAMACETPVVTSSSAFAGIVPDEWVVAEDDAPALAGALARLLALSEPKYRALGTALRAEVVRGHNLTSLADRLVVEVEAL